MSEQYDEVVFFEPTESFLHLLMAYTAKDSKQQLAPLMIVRARACTCVLLSVNSSVFLISIIPSLTSSERRGCL